MHAVNACMLSLFFFTAYLASMNYLRKCNVEIEIESLSLEATGSV